MRLSRAAAAAEEAAGDAVVDGSVLKDALRAVRVELDVPDGFAADVLADARRAVRDPHLPATDWTDVDFVTIDPPGARDLDQAMHLERRGRGYRVRYAIADVPAFVSPGSPVDDEARRRGQTLYVPDRRVPLHPPVISEDAASLLAGQVRPAFVWVLDLDDDAVTAEVDVVRAMVRSRAQLEYEGVQRDIDAGRAPASLQLLPEVGKKRIELERERGGSSLATPDQEVVVHPDGFVLRLRPPVPVEDWNAQISLMTGMAAAQMMIEGRVGILRTLPPPDDETLRRFRRQAAALGAQWPEGMAYGEFLRSLDPRDPQELALLHESASLFRGAAYTPVLGTVPEQAVQAAVAAPYAHVTAPLRRLVDRFGLVACEALCRGVDVPGWVLEALPTLPHLMSESDRRAGALERASIDAAEAAVLADRVGETFPAVVVDVGRERALVQVTSPPVLGQCDGDLRLGARVEVRLVEADPVKRTVRFTCAS
ncbi:MAG: RNB domain-containing ribonuclease [Actinomycetes bacterium]